MSDRGSISFERLASRYDAYRGGLVRGAEFASDLAGWITSPPVLEIGVGTGAVAKPLGELLHTTVLGADLSPAMAAHAKQRLGSRVMVADAQRLPVSASKIGTIVLVWVLQVVGSVAEALDETVRVLRPRGRVLAVLAPQVNRRAEDMEDRLVDWWDAIGRPRPDTAAQVQAAADAAGLTLLTETITTEQEWRQSPNEAAQQVEARAFPALLDLDDSTFARVAQPIADRLRALPEPDRPRRCAARHPLLIFEKTS